MAIGTAADIGIRVFLDDAASGGLLRINNLLQGIGNVANSSSKSVGNMMGKLAAEGALVGAIASLALFAGAIKYSVDAASELQQAMFSVAVATHVPMQEAMQYTNQLMNLAAGSTYSSQQIAAGIVLLGRSGYSIADIMGKAADGMHGMAAAGVALGIATRTDAVEGFQLLAQTMAAYNAPAAQAMKYADLLQFAFEHQTGSVSQLSSALAQVTPMAAMLGTPLREVAAALDVVGPAMGSTSKAGTALRYALSAVDQPTAKAMTEMVKLGLASVDAGGNFHSAFYNANGSAKDLTQIVQILHDKLKGMSQEQQLAALKDIFSVRGGQGMDVLLQQLPKYLGYMNQLASSNGNAGGAMQRWQQVMGTFGGAMAGLGSSIRDLGAVIGLALLPFLTQAATALNGFVSWVRNAANANPAAAATFLKLGAGISALAVVAALVALSFFPATAAIMVFVGVALATMAVIAGLAVVALLVASHWHQIVAAVTQARGAFQGVALVLLLVGATIAAIKLTSLVSSFISAIPAAVAFATTLLTQTIPAAIRFAIVLISQAVPAFFAFMATMLGGIGGVLAYAGALLLAAAAEIAVALPFILLAALIAGMIVGLVLLIQHLGGMNLILSAGRAIWAALVSTFQQVAAIIRSALLSALQQLQPVWQQLVQAFNQARPALLVLGQILGGVLVVAIGILMGILRGLVNVFVAVVVAIIGVAAGIVQVFAGIIQFFLGFFTLLHGLVTLNGAEIQAGFRMMMTGILNIVTGLWNAVKAVFVGAFNAVVGFVSGFVQGIVHFFQWLSSILVGHSIVPDMLNAIRAVFMSVLNAIVGFVQGILSRIGAFFSAAGAAIHAAWNAAMQALQQAAMAALNAIVTIISGGMFRSVGQVIAAGAQIISSARSAWSGFVSAVQGGISTAIGIVSSLPGRIMGILNGIVGAAFGAGANIIHAIANGISSAIGWVAGAIGNVVNFISSHLPHSPAKIGPLRELPYQSALIGKQIAEGIQAGTPSIQGALNVALGGITSAPSMSRLGATATSMRGGGGSQTITIPLVLDGRVVTQVVLNNINGQMQLNGLGRAFR